ncbi:unnamed protein product [Leuciscus chuanchicus]
MSRLGVAGSSLSTTCPLLAEGPPVFSSSVRAPSLLQGGQPLPQPLKCGSWSFLEDDLSTSANGRDELHSNFSGWGAHEYHFRGCGRDGLGVVSPRAAGEIEVIFRQKVATTDASLTGWGALPAFGTWTSAQRQWHTNCLELKAIHFALQEFSLFIRDHHVLIRTDNTELVAYINRQGGVRSSALQRMAQFFLLWANQHFLSIRAVHVPGGEPDMLSREDIIYGEWRLHPQTVKLIWSLFGKAEVDLFASEENARCFSL